MQSFLFLNFNGNEAKYKINFVFKPKPQLFWVKALSVFVTKSYFTSVAPRSLSKFCAFL